MTGRKRALAIGAVALAVAGGGAGIAGAAGAFGGERQAFMNDVATRLGVTPEKLQQAITGAWEARLDAAVKEGRLTQAQADAIKERMKNAGGAPLIGPGLRGPGPGFHGPGRHGVVRLRQDTAQAAAAYLGLTEAQLRERLRDGKTLADIAKAQGKTTQGLKDALTAAVKKRLDQAVADGDLTRARADEELKALTGLIDDAIAGRVAVAPGGRGLPGPRVGRGAGPSFIMKRDLAAAAAKHLGLSEERLRERLRDGKTLAQIAKERGKTTAGLKSALSKALKERLDAAVKDKRLTRAQADRALRQAREWLDDMIAGKLPGPGFGRGFPGLPIP